MFALVESGSITKMMRGNLGLKIGDNQYPADIFTKWTESERNAIGVYTIEIDNTNKKDEQWYINTGMSYAYDSSANKVKGTYGTATARAHADTLWTEKDKTDGNIPSDKDVGDVASEGLKTILIRQVKRDAQTILSETDWYVVRKADTDEAIPSAIATHRAALRTKQAADTAALETLYARNNSGVRPLGDLPRLT